MTSFVEEWNGQLSGLKYLLEGTLLESCNGNNIKIEESNATNSNASNVLLESFVYDFNANMHNFTPDQCIPRIFSTTKVGTATNIHGLAFIVNKQQNPDDIVLESYEMQAKQVLIPIEANIQKIKNENETLDLIFVYQPFEITFVETLYTVEAHISFKYNVYIQQ